ncbi:hypothetical protein ABK040_009272 [Willaertia magna]
MLNKIKGFFGSEGAKDDAEQSLDKFEKVQNLPSVAKERSNDFIGIMIKDSNLTFSDKASSIIPLLKQDIQIELTYPIIQVISTMTFKSNVSKTIEGEFVFPMPDKATLVGYALDVNGKLVDAVPIEKEKAKEVFETEVRSGGGVSIVEKVKQSNCFRTRIYPLKKDEERTIQVKYMLTLDESENTKNNELESVAFLPFQYVDFKNLSDKSKVTFSFGNDINNFTKSIYLTVLKDKQQTEEEDKVLIESTNDSKVIINKEQLNENMIGLKLKLKNVNHETNNILAAVERGYFMISIPVPELTEVQRNMKRIGELNNNGGANINILWDCSLSQLNYKEKNLNILQKVLEEVKPKQITLTCFSNTLINQNEFNDVKQLISHIDKNVFYDGGSNMLELEKLTNNNNNIDYVIAFTEGVHTFGKEVTPNVSFSKPIYFINTSKTINSTLLNHISTISGGIMLNANEMSIEKICESIGRPVLSFAVADFEESQLEEVYPNEPISVKEGSLFKLFGKVKKSVNNDVELAISFRFGSEVFHVQKVVLPKELLSKCNDNEDNHIIPLLWAQQKLQSLSTFPELFKEEMKQLGQEFKIVTDNTSLIVLETLDQYLKHSITPPESLPNVRKEYLQKLKSDKEAEEKREKQKIEKVISKWQERINWHKTDFKPQPVAKEMSKKKCVSDSRNNSGAVLRSSMMRRECCEESRQVLQSSISRSASSEDYSDEDDNDDDNMEKEEVSKKKKDKKESGANASIKVKAWTPDTPYLKAIQEAKDHYTEYLKQRDEYKDSPAFYLDVADYFIATLKRMDEGVRILSNIVELELESVQLYRIVGYRLDQSGELELAEWIFEKVKEIRPDEPQSFRDLALVKERLGKYKESMELFNKVITGKWDSRFDEIEQTAAIEMNHLLQNDDTLQIVDKRLIYKMDLDLRISMAWDTNDVDIDLHLQEPAPYGEHCYYGYNRTKIGGYVSRDFRQGYGPEEYMLKKAQPGNYRAYTNYFANHQQSLTGGTTVLCTFFTNYMRPNEKREMVTVRLTTNKQDIDVCEITVQ